MKRTEQNDLGLKETLAINNALSIQLQTGDNPFGSDGGRSVEIANCRIVQVSESVTSSTTLRDRWEQLNYIHLVVFM